MADLGNREVRILRKLAKLELRRMNPADRLKQRFTNRYELALLTGLHRQKVARSIEKLYRLGLIHYRTLKRKKWKQARRVYYITLNGFAWLLRRDPGDYEKMNIKYRKAFTPLLSNKWTYLENQGLGEYTRDLLAEASGRYLSGRDPAQVLEAHQSVGLLDILDDYFLLYANPLGGIMAAIASDPELSQGYRHALETVADYQKNWVQQRLDALKAKGRPVQKRELQIQEPELPKEAQQYTDKRIQRWRREGYLVKTPARSLLSKP